MIGLNWFVTVCIRKAKQQRKFDENITHMRND